MTRRRWLWIAAGLVTVAGAAVTTWLVTRGAPPPTSGRRAGASFAAGIITLTANVPTAPMPCARLELASQQSERQFTVGSGAATRTFRVTGAELVAEASRAGGRELVVAVIADAAGAHADTVARLSALRAELERSRVELVLLLGGMASAADELRALIEPLATEAPWAVWVVPGDREAPAVVASTTGPLGTNVVDGARVRFATIDNVVIGTLPGAPYASRLEAGVHGCVYTRDDADEVAHALSTREGTRVLVTHAPPRQRGAGASDRVPGGIHIGELDLAAALEAAPVHLVLHAGVSSTAPGGTGETRARATVHLGTTPLDALPSPGSETGALIVRIVAGAGATEPLIRWRRLRFEGPKLRAR
ncbi:MAG TPA: hypothetical protein VML75_02270 [Kofleriaceae bacterium]|nr:hypothetical protein [Kofleriaceae bacterium]